MLCLRVIGNDCVDNSTTKNGGVIGRVCGGTFEAVIVAKVSSSLFVIFAILAGCLWNVNFSHSVAYVCISFEMGVGWTFTLLLAQRPVLSQGPKATIGVT